MPKIEARLAELVQTPEGPVLKPLLRCRGCLTEKYLEAYPFTEEDIVAFRDAHRFCPEPKSSAP